MRFKGYDTGVLTERQSMLMQKANRVSWTLTALFAVYLFFFTGNSLLTSATLIFSFFSFAQLILAFGRSIPLRELTGFLMVLQLLLTPYFDYVVMQPKGISLMVVSQDAYFEYALPAVMALYIGLYLRFGKRKEFSFKAVFNPDPQDMLAYRKIGFVLVFIGYLCFFISSFLEMPSLEFFLVVLQLLRFVGLFYIWFSGSKYAALVIMSVFIPVIIITVQGSIFIDLIVWFFFLYSFAALKFRIRSITSLLLILFVMLFLIILQTVKVQYREIAWKSTSGETSDNGISLFGKLFSSQLQQMDERSYMVMNETMLRRANQGWIVSFVMNKYPSNKIDDFKNYFYPEALGIFLPRFVYPDKPKVGDNAKFRYMTGIRLKQSVAMNVGILGDGYGNFGYWGGIVFCFFFGFLINGCLSIFRRIEKSIPSIIFWIPVVFFYTMRAGNEFYIIINWMIKVSVVVLIYFLISKQARGRYL